MFSSNLNTAGRGTPNGSTFSTSLRLRDDAGGRMSFSPQTVRANSLEKGSASPGSSMYLPMDDSLVQKFRSQYPNYFKGSFGSQFPSTSKFDSPSKSSIGNPTYVLTLHFLGLSGLQKASWFERAPVYEFIVYAGGVAKRFQPRIPAPPPGVGSDVSSMDLQKCVPAEQLPTLQRLDDRASIRIASPGEFFRVDIWEERTPLLDFASKGPSKSLLGKCYIPLESKYNKRACTWPIVTQSTETGALSEVGFLTCKFGLAGMPGAVRNLRIVEGTAGENEVQLAWDPPENDGGTPLRGYRVEARDVSIEPSPASSFMFGEDAPITASAPHTAEPSVKLRKLQGNTTYAFCVWAVSEAGPGIGSEVQGKTAAVAPRICGLPQIVESRNSSGNLIMWTPPEDNGGEAIVAYRVWLRALFHNNLGERWPSETMVEVGVLEHKGQQNAAQQASCLLLLQKLPSQAIGCLCSISALNAAGHLGPTTPEVQIILRQSPPLVGNGNTTLASSYVDATSYHKRIDPFAQRSPAGSLAASHVVGSSVDRQGFRLR